MAKSLILSEIEVFASGLGFIEGPAWSRAAGTLSLVSISLGCVWTLDAAGQIIGRIDTGGGPNGLVLDGDCKFVAQNGGIFGASGTAPAGVQRIADNFVELVPASGFVAPNDLCFGPDGRLWVSDPETDRAVLEPFEGRVLAMEPTTGATEIAVEKRLFPNGLAFDAGGTAMYLALTYPRQIERFRFADGKLSSEGILCELTGGRPDGMALDEEGNLWICTPGSGGLEVFSAAGNFLERIEFGTGTMTTNCCFGGPDMNTLFVTAAGRGEVLRLQTGTRGLPLRKAP